MDCSLKFGCMNKKLLVIVNHYVTVNPAWRFWESFMWDKLPNSGEVLKILVPSSIWKYISGWVNSSGMVTSQNMSENKMDNRGSKSITDNNPTSQTSVFVKEQREDGDCRLNSKRLRCSLMSFERNSQIKALPTRNILQFKGYSTAASQFNNSYLKEFKALNPWFVSGFTDAEGSFSVTIRKNPRSSTWWVDHRFSGEARASYKRPAPFKTYSRFLRPSLQHYVRWSGVFFEEAKE